MRNEKGQFAKGEGFWKGKKRGKMSWLIGYKHKPETIKKIKKARKRQGGNIGIEKRKGKHYSPKTEFKKGQKPWNAGLPKEKSHLYGKHQPEEVRRKIGYAQMGEKNHAWKGGLTSLRGKIYDLFEWRQWRSDIFQRDGFVCVLCGSRGGRLEADHYPKKFSWILQENKIDSVQKAIDCSELWNVNNGRTLCRDCHLKTDTYGRREPR